MIIEFFHVVRRAFWISAAMPESGQRSMLKGGGAPAPIDGTYDALVECFFRSCLKCIFLRQHISFYLHV